MERTQAIKKLRKLLGNKLAYEVNPYAPTRQEREEVKPILKEACVERDRLDSLMNARRREVLAADPEYQRLVAERKEAGDRVSKLNGRASGYKFQVGHIDGLAGFKAFFVKASGDSWEEVIAKLEKKKEIA